MSPDHDNAMLKGNYHEATNVYARLMFLIGEEFNLHLYSESFMATTKIYQTSQDKDKSFPIV